MKKTSLMRRLVGLGFALLIVTANLPIGGAMIKGATRSEVQDGANTFKACGAEENDVPIYKHSYALVIGQSKYQSWTQLPGAERDVQEVEKILKEHGFTVRVLRDPTRSEFDKAISDFKEKHDRTNASRFLLYFSGHGYTEITPLGFRLGYIVPSDAPSPGTNSGRFSAIAISMNVIETIAKDISPCHALFVFDSCFSGSIFTEMRGAPDAITTRAKQPVRLFITASSATEKVPDDSLFRQAFVRGLQGAADLNKDKYVTGTELGEFLMDVVPKYSGATHTPRYGKIRDARLDQGDFVFVLPKDNKSAGDFQPEVKSKPTPKPTPQPTPQVSTGPFQPFALDSKYYPSGWMGMIKGVEETGTGTLTLERQAMTVEGKATLVTRIEYKPGAEKGWAGIYWQHPDKNWGDKPGMSLKGAKRITFYAKGEEGGEIVEFISGGIDKKEHKDQFKESNGPTILNKEWTKYEIDLSKLKDDQLSNVIGAFAWVGIGSFDTKGRLVTYIADLRIE